MKIVNNKIVEATENELFDVYLRKGYDDIMDFQEFVCQCKKAGTVVINEKDRDHHLRNNMINFKIQKLLEKKAKEFKFPGMHSTWFLKNDYIYIVTTYPGYWIGKAGKNVFELNEEIAKICEEEKLPKLTIRFIESGRSMPDEKEKEK